VAALGRPHRLIVVVGHQPLLIVKEAREVQVALRLWQIADVAQVVHLRLLTAEAVPVDSAALVGRWASVASSLALGVGISGRALKGLARIVSRGVVLIHAGMAARASSASEVSGALLAFSNSVGSNPVVASSAHRLVANVANRCVVVRMKGRRNHLVPVQVMNVGMNVPVLNDAPQLEALFHVQTLFALL